MGELTDQAPVQLEYAPPEPPGPAYSKLLSRALISIMVVSLVFGLGGAIVGLLLGYFTPDFYRAMFQYTNAPMSPCAIGFGLGLTVGGMLGAFIGLLLVFVFAWRETRLRK
jgi:hypothetical protein